jgi:hypothetical protein
VALYLATARLAGTDLWMVAVEHNWGEFWRVAVGPTGTTLAAAGAVLAAYFTVLNGERSPHQDRESGTATAIDVSPPNAAFEHGSPRRQSNWAMSESTCARLSRITLGGMLLSSG